MIKNIEILILLIAISIFKLQAQDFHFSQFNASPLNLNPALTGNFDGDLRAVGNEKRQWMTFTNAYQTFSLSADARLQQLRLGRFSLGAGLLFNTDKAGDASFGTNQIKLCGALHIKLKDDSTINFSLGLNGGYNQHNINYSALTFGNQFNGNQFDPSMTTGESFNADKISYLDVSAGVALSYKINATVTALAGYTLNHINKPEQSFADVRTVELDRKFTVHAGAEIRLAKDLTLFPSTNYQRQGNLNELNWGSLLKMNTTNISFHAIYVGGWIRSQDAGIVEFRFDYRNFNCGISYDINLSKLSVISKGKGGLELSVIYIFKKYRAVKMPYYKKCPTYL